MPENIYIPNSFIEPRNGRQRKTWGSKTLKSGLCCIRYR